MSNLALIADKDTETVAFLNSVFEKEGMRTLAANNGKEALSLALKNTPAIIVMETMLEGIDGIELCTELRNKAEFKNTIIVFYTIRGEDYSQIIGLNAGADDYVIKPVKGTVLGHRIKALLKRAFGKAAEVKSSIPNDNGFYIDRERYLIVKNGKEVILPRKEFELLSLLYSAPRKVFSRKDISNKIWGYEMSQKNRTIDVHIRKLREKLGESYIKTLKGVGYSFDL